MKRSLNEIYIMTKKQEETKKAEKAEEKVGASALAVYKNNSFIREFSVEIHGEKFRENAETFASKINGEVRKSR